MGVELSPSGIPARTLSRPVEETARLARADPRVTALVPGFDAPFFQAGLAGYSDGAMRLVARAQGAPFCVTEALLDRTLINGGKGRRKEDPDLIASEVGMGELEDNRAAGLDDHPLAGQVMGSWPDEMARGAEILCGMGHEVIDVNLACPVKKIKRKARGGHFLACPDDAVGILRAVRDAVPAGTPCTVKLRRSFSDTQEMERNFERIFDAAYELGYAWSTVHCRTVEQKYHGPGRWEFLRDLVRRRPDRVIFGSGDVWTVLDIFRMIDVCGVQGVSVARGCIGNPWIFRQARDMMAGREPMGPSVAEQREVLLAHWRFSEVIHGERRTGRHMRKFGIKFAQHHPHAMDVKRDFIRCETGQEWREVIERHYGPEAESRALESGWRPARVTDASAAMAMADADLDCGDAGCATSSGSGGL
ncbi:MAG: tRNA-dihydrouridine synthase family protein [Planctomycetes bacterium]|nr:tRNA-dihydrouridine synthase family protein [Planctomycetota bacterium]